MYPRGIGPFQVVERINDNAYKIDLPGEYGVSASFNVSDLSPFKFSDSMDSRTSHFEEGGTDMNIKTGASKGLEAVDTPLRSRFEQEDPLEGMKGPMTRSKSKKMQEALTQLIRKVHDDDQLTKSKESISCTVLQVISTSPFSDKKSLSQRSKEVT